MSGGASHETKTIVLSHLIRDQSIQVRRKLDQPTINRYVEVLKAGSSMPAIKIAFINGAPVLIDGWHRVAAMEQLGWTRADADVVELATEKEIYWLAAKANMEHGLPLKKSELRQVFRAYVEAGQHKKNRGRFKSYREMQGDLSIPYSTIRTWMRSDFRHIAAKMGKDDDFKGKGGLRSSHDPSSLQGSVLQGLDETKRVFQSTVDPEVRGQIISHMDELLDDMKQAGNWKLPPAPDF